MYNVESRRVSSVKDDPLRKSKATEILITLLQGTKNFSELLEKVGGSASTVKLRLDELVDTGLLQEDEQPVFPFKRTFKLTPKGKTIAKLSKRLHSVLDQPKISERKPKDQEKWILMLLHVLKKIRGSTRLEKVLFLLDHKFNAVGDRFYKFRPQKFGPFCAEILEDAKELEKAGLVAITEEVFEPKELLEDWIICRTYTLTPKGKQIAQKSFKRASKSTKKAIRSLRQFNRMMLTELLDYVYSNYAEESKGALKIRSYGEQ